MITALTLVLRPSANGDLSLIYPRCSPFPGGNENWQNVDEEIADDFLTYNYHSGSGGPDVGWPNGYSYVKVDNFRLPPISPSFIPQKVGIRLRARRTSTQCTATPQLLFQPDWEYWGANSVPFVSQNVWTEGYNEWLLNPHTGQPWTVAAISEMQAGYRLAIAEAFTLKTIYCTQFSVEISGLYHSFELPITTQDNTVLVTESVYD